MHFASRTFAVPRPAGALRPYRRLLSLLAAVVVSGCDPASVSTPPVVFDAGPSTPAGNPAVFVEVSVEPQADDPRWVDVWVSAPHPAFWDSVAEDPGALRWEGLVVVRPQSRQVGKPAPRPGAPPRAAGAEDDALPGDYAVVDERLRFRLAEPLRIGEGYRIEFHRSVLQRVDEPGSPDLLPVIAWHHPLELLSHPSRESPVDRRQ